MNTERVRNDFDEIARLSDCHGVGSDRYDSFLMSLVPMNAVSVLDVGCGLGRLTAKLATRDREVVGVDLSPEMIARATKAGQATGQLTFLCGDFLEQGFAAQQFDCVISAATLHHMPEDVAMHRMTELLRPGGRLVIHDMRADGTLEHGVNDVSARGFAPISVATRFEGGALVLKPEDAFIAVTRHLEGDVLVWNLLPLKRVTRMRRVDTSL